MKKILVLIVILAAIWAVPAARQRISVAALPVLERLGPVGDRVASPVRTWKARNQAKFFLRLMRDDATEGRQPPDPRQFPEWMQRRTPREEHVDPWGNRYWMRRAAPNTIIIGSDGADGVRDTDDDVTESAAF